MCLSLSREVRLLLVMEDPEGYERIGSMPVTYNQFQILDCACL
jgi:hypothetical protein